MSRMSFMLVMLASILTCQQTFAQAERLIVFYDPDSNQQVLASVTRDMNAYLAERNLAVKFQAVNATKRLQDLISSQAVYAIAYAPWLKRNAATTRCAPTLIAQQKGQVTYRKLLVNRGVLGSLKSLQGKSVAASGGDASEIKGSLARLLKGSGVDTSGAFAIPVAKDIDALFALAFDQVQLALVTSQSVELFKRLNPAVAAQLTIVSETSDVLRPVMCVVGKASDSAEIVNAFKTMHEAPAGKSILTALSIDRWVDLPADVWERP